MTRFTGKATAITPNRELQPDEYFNETDHLIYCSKCNTPRQCRHELQGKVLIPSIRCKCQQEIFEQEETQRKLHEKQMEIEHLKTSGLQDKALYAAITICFYPIVSISDFPKHSAKNIYRIWLPDKTCHRQLLFSFE